jgi:hypothetical protein
VGFNDGAANRQAHSHAVRLAGEEGVEQPIDFVGFDANAGVLRRNEQLAVFAEFGLDCQFARPVNDRFHRVDRVDD